MKRILLTAFTLTALALSSYGQGTLTFNNSTTTLVVYQLNYGSPDTAPLPVGSGYVEIFWAPLGTTDLQLFQPVPGLNPIPISVTAGRFTGGTRTIPAGSGFSGIAPGATVSAYLRGWTGTANAWYDGSLGQVGYSPIFTIDTGDPTASPGGIPGTLYAGGNNQTGNAFTGLTLLIIPEPSSVALLLMGCGLLGWRSRRSAV